MASNRIIGIILVQNEDLYLLRVLQNIADFCDEIIVADHLSKDGTAEIAKNFRKANCKIRYQRITKTSQSHELIEVYAGKPVWIFAVDGDEIYDPKGLLEIKEQIAEGQFDRYWMVLGNVLNCTELDMKKKIARGFLAPPCRSMTKFYNFNAITSWDGPCPERLHGGTIQFKPGYHQGLRLELYKSLSWENSKFRCLHLCFIRRSSLEEVAASGPHLRKNISDKNSEGFFAKLWGFCFPWCRKRQDSHWKKEKYMRGERVTEAVDGFFLKKEKSDGKPPPTMVK